VLGLGQQGGEAIDRLRAAATMKQQQHARTPQEIGLSVKRLQARHHRMANAQLAPLGISLVQWDALRHLRQNPEASLHDLAQLTFQTDQSFGALAARMTERGLIERVPGPGRAVRHRLTAKGEQLRQAGDEIVGKVLTDSFAPLTPAQLETFDQLLRRLLDAHEQDPQD
jgi:DNA-binding MarR family transcriptional regulator